MIAGNELPRSRPDMGVIHPPRGIGSPASAAEGNLSASTFARSEESLFFQKNKPLNFPGDPDNDQEEHPPKNPAAARTRTIAVLRGNRRRGPRRSDGNTEFTIWEGDINSFSTDLLENPRRRSLLSTKGFTSSALPANSTV
jgi:hypothetical protein